MIPALSQVSIAARLPFVRTYAHSYPQEILPGPSSGPWLWDLEHSQRDIPLIFPAARFGVPMIAVVAGRRAAVAARLFVTCYLATGCCFSKSVQCPKKALMGRKVLNAAQSRKVVSNGVVEWRRR